jgi:signal peptidase
MGAAYISNNWTPLMVVTTGSMEPILQVGDLIYVKGVEPSEIQVGDIITFRPPLEFISGTLITHRVVDITYDVNEVYFKTKGDNNPSVDPWTIESGEVIGRQEATFKGLGNLFLWVKTPVGLTTMLALASLYLFLPNIRQALGGMKNK